MLNLWPTCKCQGSLLLLQIWPNIQWMCESCYDFLLAPSLVIVSMLVSCLKCTFSESEKDFWEEVYLSLINYALWLKKTLFLWNLQLVRTSPQRKNWHQEQVQHVSLLFLVHFCASIFLTTYDYENQATVKLKWFKYQTKQRNLNLHFDHVLNVTVLAYKYYTVIMNNTWCDNNI